MSHEDRYQSIHLTSLVRLLWCTRCGAYVYDTVAHDRWHDEWHNL